MATMRLNNLVYSGKHGIADWEKETAQRFAINVELETDLEKATQTDQLGDSLNWKDLRAHIQAIVENESYNLVETLTERIVKKLFENIGIQTLRIEVQKLDIWDGNGYPSIIITKTRH